MRAVIQRVKDAQVSVEGNIEGKIDNGLLVYIAIGDEDTEKDIEYVVKKIVNLRIFQDENDKMNLSVKDIQGEILIISQFTLYGDIRKGRRPNFMKSAEPTIAKKMYEEFIEKIKSEKLIVQSGVFAADMDVTYTNDGPVTILLDSEKTF
ncbi:MAG TPA: D-aminoacyl-tRNA deacylase [Tissierellaceae bacterium]